MPLTRDPHDDSRNNMQLSAQSWAASTSYATSPRRPFAIGDTPSSPASSTASQKFEVKRLLSRPADPASSSRPLTLVAPTTGRSTTASDLQPPIKRSNSLGKAFLKRRPSRTQEDAGSTPKARHLTLDDEPVPSLPPYPLSDPPTITPASAYAQAYAQRTRMSSVVDSHIPSSSTDREHLPTRARSKSRPRAPSEPAEGRARQPFRGVTTGRIAAVGDPPDSKTSALALAGAGPTKKPTESDSFGRGLTRKVSARFRRRKMSSPNAGIMSDGEADVPIRSQSRRKNTIDWKEWEAGRQDWSREKERVGLRGIGIAFGSNNRSPAASSSSSPRLADQDVTMGASRASRKRLSRHLSIEDFQSFARLEQEMGMTFEMWEPKAVESRPEVDKLAERKRADSTNRKERTRRDLAALQEKQMAATAGRSGIKKEIPMARMESQPPLFRKDDLHTIYKESSPAPSLKGDPTSKRSTMIRSESMPSESPTSTGATSPECRKENKIWRLVKKMSTGTLKEKKSYQAEKAPPVPPLPTSRRSSVYDYGEEVRVDLARFGVSREPGSATGSIHSGPSSLSGHATISNTPQPQPPSQPSRHRSASSSRPSLSYEWRPSMTNDSAPSSSPKSSFGRIQSPRTSMSSYIETGEDVPPLPLGKHIVSPVELAQQCTPRDREPLSTNNSNTGVGASPSLPPPKRPRTAQKSRDKATSNITPLSSPALSNATQSPKLRPNVLRRPTKLNENGLSIPTLSPRPASTASPRSPRSASMGMPSPRPRAQTQSQDQLPPRPRSNSLGTVFTFRELGNTETRSKLTEQEKVAKFEQLLEASEKAGGTLHARLHDRALLSDTMRMSGTFDGASIVSEL